MATATASGLLHAGYSISSACFARLFWRMMHTPMNDTTPKELRLAIVGPLLTALALVVDNARVSSGSLKASVNSVDYSIFAVCEFSHLFFVPLTCLTAFILVERCLPSIGKSAWWAKYVVTATLMGVNVPELFFALSDGGAIEKDASGVITYGAADESDGRQNPRTAIPVIIASSLLNMIAGVVQWRSGRGRLYLILMSLCLVGNGAVGPFPTAMLLFGNFMEQVWLASATAGLYAGFFPAGSLDGDARESAPLNAS